MGVWDWMSQDIGIDLGTANTLVYVKGRGIVAQEPSVVAVDDKKRVLAVGMEAKLMIGRTPGHITACRPLQDGVIADYDVTIAMLRYFLAKGARGRLVKSRCVIGVPGSVTDVEKRAIRDAALQAGAREAMVMEEPLLAAIGAGLPVGESTGSMVVDIGGGTSDVAVTSMGGLVTCQSVRVAGDEMDEAIIQHLRRKHSLMIGPRTAEEIKCTIGTAIDPNPETVFAARGRDLVYGLPRTVSLTAVEVHGAIRETVQMIVDAARRTLENTPPELLADVMDRGICLTGGGALLKGIDRLLERETGVRTYLADEPLLCVVKGTAVVLENSQMLRRILKMVG